jgi:hypothetical protein
MFSKRWNSGTALLVVLCVTVLFAFKEEKDPLHKRVFNISLGESKEGVVAKKNIADKWYFKDGKLFSDYLNAKFNYSWFRYRINKDSVFTDSTDTEVRLLEVEASTTDEANQTVIVNFTQLEWDLDGTVKITKNDKIKRFFDIAGREKGGKPKKVKKTEKKILEVVPDGKQPDKMYEETISVPGTSSK